MLSQLGSLMNLAVRLFLVFESSIIISLSKCNFEIVSVQRSSFVCPERASFEMFQFVSILIIFLFEFCSYYHHITLATGLCGHQLSGLVYQMSTNSGYQVLLL